MSENRTAALEALNISKVYCDGDRELQVLKDISLSVKSGEGVAILGPSGSGKTTLLNILSGLDRPSGGEVRLGGVGLNKMGEKEKARLRNETIGFVFQFYHLLAEFTALENVMLPSLIAPGRRPDRQIKEKAMALLERVGLKERQGHFPSELSGGEQQRAAIARALMNDPEILFCDEPTGNLDREMGREITALLKDLFSKDKKTVLVVTHDERIAKMADRVWDIVKGDWESQYFFTHDSSLTPHD